MAVLVEEKVGERNDVSVKHELMEWHPTRGLLALTTYNGSVGGEINFFTHEGTKSDHAPILKPNARVTHLSWHPVMDIISIGWDSREVTFRFMQKEQDFSLPTEGAPSSKISCIMWSASEPKICIAEKDGKVVLWNVANGKKGAIKLIDSTVIGEEANCICRRTLENITPKQDDPTQVDVKFSRRRESNSAIYNSGTKSNEYFIIGGANGGIHIHHESGETGKIFKLDSAVVQLIYIEGKSQLIALSEELCFHQLIFVEDNNVKEKIRVKLNGKWPNFQMITIGSGILAMCNDGKDVRYGDMKNSAKYNSQNTHIIWDLNNEENGIISLNAQKGFGETDTVTCISYTAAKDCLSGGTSEGKVANWKHRKKEESLDKQWILQEAINIGSKIETLCWGTISCVLAISTGVAVTLLKEQSILSCISKNMAVLQCGLKKLLLVRLEPTIAQQELQIPISIKGFHLGEKHLSVWDEKEVYLYEIFDTSDVQLKVQPTTNFKCSSSAVVVYEQSVFCIEGDKINVRTYQGTVKQIISMPEMEGDLISMDINGSWMCVTNSNGFIRIYDLSTREARQQYHAKNVSETIKNFKSFINVKLNKSGNRVSFTCCVGEDKNIYPGIMVWNADSDVISSFNFMTGMTDQQEADADAAFVVGNHYSSATANRTENQKMGCCLPEHSPGYHCWDSEDSRYLICEANYRKPNIVNNLKVLDGPNYLLSIFVTSEDGLHMHDLRPRSQNSESLLGCSVPYIYFIHKADSEDECQENEKRIANMILRQVVREFVGLEDSDAPTKEAIMNFLYYLTVDKMDEAFKAIKFIKRESIWEHMAHMCVKTRRLDVALICLGNMGHARGARALRKSIRNGDPLEVQVAILAIQLGLLDEAQALFAKCERYDLINRLLQTRNRWDEAFVIAEKHDRIHLRNTYYNYANHLESVGAIECAIENYEKSNTHRFEVPRMLFDDPYMLEGYVKKTKDQGVQKWWAQYMESKGEMKAARMYYQYAKDYLSVVRLLCYSNNIDEAVEIANNSDDKAAYYHLGQYFEAHDDPEKAVTFFTKAHACSNALRLAKEHNMKDLIANLALLAGGNELVEAAQYYENVPGQADKAVMLYHKAGMIGRALDLAFRTEQFSALDLIANDLDENSDPRTLERAAEFFKKNQRFDKAVQLMTYLKHYSEAIDLCKQKNVLINESLAEALTPSKEDVSNQVERMKLLKLLAECCVQQQNYHLSAKKYTQAGDKLEAMRSLVKSGDTQKIVFFATTARNKEIYILAANYLQTLNWREDGDLMRQIESFYSKANAYEHLAGFYQACAQVKTGGMTHIGYEKKKNINVEIDDYRDYNKAIDALNEALRCITKVLQTNSVNESFAKEKQAELNRTISDIKKFVKIKTVYEMDPTDAIRQLEALADDKQARESIRSGDIYAIMIVHYFQNSNYKKAYSLIQQLKDREPTIVLNNYISNHIQNTICDELKLPRFTDNADNGSDSGEEPIESEDIDYSYAMKRRIQQDSKAYKEDEN